MSTLGLGTYLGHLSDDVSAQIASVIQTAVQDYKIHTIDTAINYRCQRSERLIGNLIHTHLIERSQLFLSTKGGFIPFDKTIPNHVPSYIQSHIGSHLQLAPEHIFADCHCLEPKYIEWSFHQSLKNLKTDYIDCYFIHNPEFALGFISRNKWEDLIIQLFSWLESQVLQGRCRGYGLATWQGLRMKPDHPYYIDLEQLWLRASQNNLTHFKALQLPFNVHMPEFISLTNQRLSETSWVNTHRWAEERSMTVLTSAPFLQGQLIHHFRQLDEMKSASKALTPAQHLLDWIFRHVPRVTTLIGTTSISHLKEACSRLP